MLSRGAVHERQIRSAFVQFCLRHGIGNGSGICVTIDRPHKSATCAGSTRTLAPLIIPTTKETSTFRRKAICISLAHQPGATPIGAGRLSLMLDLELAVRSARRVLRLASNRSTRTGNRHWLSGFDNASSLRGARVKVGAGGQDSARYRDAHHKRDDYDLEMSRSVGAIKRMVH
jgi:hypothetical protein